MKVGKVANLSDSHRCAQQPKLIIRTDYTELFVYKLLIYCAFYKLYVCVCLCVELHVGKYLYSTDVFKILDTVNKVSNEKKKR